MISDGLPDSIEALFGSDPHNKADTDGDGILDGFEVKGWATSPTLKDTNFNGCTDNIEIADVNGDYKVNNVDLLIVARALAHQIAYNADFDINKDQLINNTDLMLVAQQTNEDLPVEIGKPLPSPCRARCAMRQLYKQASRLTRKVR